MKIAVTRCDGDTEILTLNEPLRLVEGLSQAMIHSAEGMDHFFRLSDGKYDGWGAGAPDQEWTEEQEKTMISHISSQRQIILVTIRSILIVRLKKVAWFIRWHWNHFLKTPGF